MNGPEDPRPSSERKASARDSFGPMIAGDGNRVEHHTTLPPPRPPVAGDAVARINNLKAPDSRVFKGRENTLTWLGKLPSTGTGLVARSVRGMGGVGKSTLVLHHAHRRLNRGGGPVWWIDAETGEQVTAGLAALATALEPTLAGLPLEDAAQWAVTWLQGRTGWLLVFDNVEEPARLRPLLGRLTTGQVLITTRRDLAWEDDPGTALRLDTLAPSASLSVLQDLTGRHTPECVRALSNLADELGHLPLGLQQAGAYLAQTRTPAADYLARLRTDPAAVLGTAAPGDPHQRTIARLWNVTLESLRRTDRSAVTLLQVLAYYAPEPLPRDVLSLGTARLLNEALGLLAAYSLVTLTDTTVTVHRLVQAVLRAADRPCEAPPQRDRLTRLTRRLRPGAAIDPLAVATGLLDDALRSEPPDELAGWPRWQDLLPHIHAVAAHLGDTDPRPPATARLWVATARYLRARGRPDQALAYSERALRITPDRADRDTALVLGELAATLSALGRYSDALPLRERALHITETTLGPEHPHIAPYLNNLAGTLAELGRHSDALPLQQRALRIAETTLGPEHPSAITASANLASALGILGRHDEALPLQERALHLTQAGLGPGHPDTALCILGLAGTLVQLRRPGDALPLQRRALHIAESTLGPEHPVTATVLNDLGITTGLLGHREEALSLLERSVHAARATLGPDHPDTSRARDVLARLQEAADADGEGEGEGHADADGEGEDEGHGKGDGPAPGS